jgi:hypothetical protein
MADLYGNEVKVNEEFELEKRKRVSLFDWLNDLNKDKVYLFNENTQSDFSPFMVNRGMSQNVETVMIANEVNKHWQISKEMAHDFYYYILSSKKRFGKWSKQSDDNKEELDLIMRYYTVNRKVAITYLNLLTKDDIDKLKLKYAAGGKSK